jgi:hypothetical protein
VLHSVMENTDTAKAFFTVEMSYSFTVRLSTQFDLRRVKCVAFPAPTFTELRFALRHYHRRNLANNTGAVGEGGKTDHGY